jgi:superfamily II DNA or RNA helicase
MRIEVDTLKSKICTDNPKLLSALVSLYSFNVPGREFVNAYKNKHWDGKQHFINKSGVFRTGLLPQLLTDLEKIDCVPEIKYVTQRKDSRIADYSLDNFTFYGYQEELIELAIKEKRGVVKSPTGSGKTLIMAAIIKALGPKKMVVLFNSKQLLTQTYDFLVDTCNFTDVGLCFGEGYTYGDIMLCTVQSIEKILDTHLEETEVLMTDECHEFCQGRTTLAAIHSFPKATYRIGFSATPPKDPIRLYNLQGAFGRIWEVVKTKNLVDQGTLAKPIIQLIKMPYTASGVDQDMPYLDIYESFIIRNEARNNKIKEIVNEIKRTTSKARILILTKSLDHGRSLENLLGGSTQFLEGAHSIGERYQAISRFRGCRKSSVLIGTKILQTGINIEEITHFINARGMKSEIATLQALGRALRRHPDKSVVFIYDFLDQERYLKTHSNERKKFYKREGHQVEVL